MGKRYLYLIIPVLILFFQTARVYGVDCTNGGVGTYDIPDDTCSNECVSPKTCELDDGGDYRCCFDLTAVPELPSWFGPFFLATLVAAWEYWRVHRRKSSVQVAKSSDRQV
ncbi:MAG: hypothetical protein ACKOA8_14615 [Deltaproteobacteria bacterium]